MAVHDNKAYLFRGRPALDYFDLVNERWGQLQTSFNHANGRPAPWPHQAQSLSDFAMHIVRGRMYVFGGTPHESKLGCNYFAVLDLVTRRWEHLSGTVSPPVPDDSCPGPRKYTASWVDAQSERIYVLQGMADRAASKMFHQPHAAQDSHAYDDYWSWGISERKWRRERLVGNPPCPRTEMACTFIRAGCLLLLFVYRTGFSHIRTIN
ncbi:hypothetical protein AcV7_003977 [Taiwanofungus camphoratus]|nr:hypothetical protein AcV7_003977 [Antrodia cinnamomea]